MRLIFIIVLFFGSFVFSQVPRFAKYPISDSGAEMYFPMKPTWEKSLSDDKSEVYVSEVNFGEADYGTVVVKLNQEAINGNDDPEGLMITYLNYLNENYLKLTSKTDIGKGHTLEGQADVLGILEYGEDANGKEYTIKCWTNKYMIAVMYVASKKEVNYNFKEMFFAGFRFPK